MAYEDVPDRLLAGEAVPRSEIIGYEGEDSATRVTLCLEFLAMALILEKVYEDDTLKFRVTSFGQDFRIDFVRRIEGDCPDCPECP
jgi:hypothetical protein